MQLKDLSNPPVRLLLSGFPGDLCWAAGFIEGEGCFTPIKWLAKGKTYWYLRIRVCQVQREPLEKLRAIFGGEIKGPYGKRKPGHQPIYEWQIYHEEALAIMVKLWHLMSPRRQDQILDALKTWNKHGRRGNAAKPNADAASQIAA